MPRDMNNQVKAEYVRQRLKDAGKTIMMLPDKVRPTGYQSAWPEHLRELLDMLDWTEEGLAIVVHEGRPQKIRASLHEINQMSEVIYNWQPRLAAHCLAKRIPWVARCLALSMLHYPDTGKQVWGPTKLARNFKTSRQSVYNWNEDGINILVNLLSQK